MTLVISIKHFTFSDAPQEGKDSQMMTLTAFIKLYASTKELEKSNANFYLHSAIKVKLGKEQKRIKDTVKYI